MKKIFYVIGYNGGGGGIGAIYFQTLAFIIYALNKGYIPIVDMQHYYNQYFKDGRVYKDNSWEYFFEQPCGYTLNDLDDDSEIIISKPSDISGGINLNLFLRNIPRSRVIYKDYFNKVKFNKSIEKYLKDSYQEIIGGEQEVLGILCRGTDYVNNKPYAHPVQPDPKVIINKAKELLKKYNYKKIWLATEDNNIYNMFRNEFGDMLINNPQYRFSDTSHFYLADVKIDRENHSYNLGKEYLRTLYILSKCKYIIGGRTAGIVFTWIISNGFLNQKYVCIWNLGFYRIKLLKRLKAKIKGNLDPIYISDSDNQ